MTDEVMLFEPMHEWFELTYAQYLTIPRSVLQSMPVEWQRRFADCLYELDETIDWRPPEGRYWVELRDAQGRFRQDPFKEYRHAPRVAHRPSSDGRAGGDGALGILPAEVITDNVDDLSVQ